MALAEVKPFPFSNVQDIPRGLRALADQIEQGHLGPVRSIAWVVEIDGAPVEIGLLGPASEIAPAAHLLLGSGMRALEIG